MGSGEMAVYEPDTLPAFLVGGAYVLNHSAGKHDRGPLFFTLFSFRLIRVVQLVQFKFKIF